jgi:hypothetical protein
MELVNSQRSDTLGEIVCPGFEHSFHHMTGCSLGYRNRLTAERDALIGLGS